MGMEKLGKPLPELTEREIKNFWNNVNKDENPYVCWEWKAACQRNGYGVFAVRRGDAPLVRDWPTITMRSHRMAFFLYTGTNPGTLCVLHKCDNRKCCNPRHLFIGTKDDNNRDMREKGRAHVLAKGQDSWKARLTEKQVLEIRELRGTILTHRQIAKIYDVAPTTISAILNRQSWKYLH